MHYMNIVTVVTAVIGAVLGIINLFLIIQDRLTEKIKIYGDDALELKCKINKSDIYCEEGDYKVFANFDYVLNILNNKNRSVVVENILWHIEYNNYLKIDNYIDTYNILINKNDMKTINECRKICITLNYDMERNAIEIFPSTKGIIEIIIDGKIYKKLIRISVSFQLIN